MCLCQFWKPSTVTWTSHNANFTVNITIWDYAAVYCTSGLIHHPTTQTKQVIKYINKASVWIWAAWCSRNLLKSANRRGLRLFSNCQGSVQWAVLASDLFSHFSDNCIFCRHSDIFGQTVGSGEQGLSLMATVGGRSWGNGLRRRGIKCVTCEKSIHLPFLILWCPTLQRLIASYISLHCITFI